MLRMAPACRTTLFVGEQHEPGIISATMPSNLPNGSKFVLLLFTPRKYRIPTACKCLFVILTILILYARTLFTKCFLRFNHVPSRGQTLVRGAALAALAAEILVCQLFFHKSFKSCQGGGNSIPARALASSRVCCLYQCGIGAYCRRELIERVTASMFSAWYPSLLRIRLIDRERFVFPFSRS